MLGAVWLQLPAGVSLSGTQDPGPAHTQRCHVLWLLEMTQEQFSFVFEGCGCGHKGRETDDSDTFGYYRWRRFLVHFIETNKQKKDLSDMPLKLSLFFWKIKLKRLDIATSQFVPLGGFGAITGQNYMNQNKAKYTEDTLNSSHWIVLLDRCLIRKGRLISEDSDQDVFSVREWRHLHIFCVLLGFPCQNKKHVDSYTGFQFVASGWCPERFARCKACSWCMDTYSLVPPLP